jgi:sec-independent protein translocase protein TatB
MFDMSWLEFAVIGLAVILVLGPKELPYAMRKVARFMRKARRLASEFQGHMDDLVREADLDEVRRSVNSIKNKDIGSAISQAVDPTGEYTRDLNETLASARSEVSDIKAAAGRKPALEPRSAASTAQVSKSEKDAAPAVTPAASVSKEPKAEPATPASTT